MYPRMLVRKQPVQFQVDCGASVNILPLKYAEGEELDSCLQTPVMWSGTKVAPVGSCVLPVVNPKTNEKYKVRLLVVKEHLTPLVDLNATQKMKLLTDTKKNSLMSWRMQMMIPQLGTWMLLTNVSEHFQEEFTCKVTQIVNILSPQQEKSLSLFGRSSKKSSKGWNVLRSFDVCRPT